MDGKRQLQIGELIKRSFAPVFHEQGPYIYGTAFVTVTAVKVTPDLAQAKIYLSIYNAEDKDLILKKIVNHTHVLKQVLAAKVKHQMRRIPKQTKTGIALSGGGFRASYFHIGVLAALAENDKLKDIEVISCVSGGSILGAFYYLELRNLLQREEESQLSSSSYITLIENMIPKFHNGVQNNLRMKWFTNPISNIKIAALNTYSRTNRMAELYDKYFYSTLTQTTKITLKDTTIAPKGIDGFTIQNSNYEIAYKVPQLILNTTSLIQGIIFNLLQLGWERNTNYSYAAFAYASAKDSSISFKCLDIAITQLGFNDLPALNSEDAFLFMKESSRWKHLLNSIKPVYTTNPKAVKVIDKDVLNFWKAYDLVQENPYLGQSQSSRQFSERTAQKIDEEVEKIINECYKHGDELLQQNRDKLDLLAKTFG